LLLPLTLKWAHETGCPLPQALSKVSSNAASILGTGSASMAVGSVADLCVFDPELTWLVAREALKSQGKHTPFLGMQLTGRTVATLIEGRIVYESPARLG
jgi:dihydroorotase